MIEPTTPKIGYTMGGETYDCAVMLYGNRVFFRDRNVLSKTKCSFSIKLKDLEQALQYAKENPSELGDVLFVEINQDDRTTPNKGQTTLDVEDEEEEDEE